MLATSQGTRVLAMKIQKGILSFFVTIVLLSVNPLFAQAPPNDNFNNRTVLTGSSITFGGSLSGATLEPGENYTSYYSIPSWATASIWWTWTAPVSSPVVIAISRAQQSYNDVAVYAGTNLNALTIANYEFFVSPAGRYVRFNATAGTSYQIQVAGSDIQPFSLQLTATNAPVFIFQPQNCTVSPYGSASFSAMASGPHSYLVQPNTKYQWFFNGTPIAGQIFPSLVVHGVTTNQAGNYSVTATNVDGIALSSVVTLTITDTNPVPGLAVLPLNNPNLLQFNLTGEPGRWYKVESSTNLQNWVNPIWLQLTNPTVPLSIQRLTPNHFVRASLDVPTEVCVAQLKQMHWGTTIFAIENEKNSTDTYSLNDVHWYCPVNSNGLMSPCPEDGIYSPGATITNAPTCTLHARGHVIPGEP
jgi:hypothetical protein